MKNLFRIIVSAVALAASSACVPTSSQVSLLSGQSQLSQASQEREFKATKKIAFDGVVYALQKLGYTVNSANLESGTISGSGLASKNTNFGEFFYAYLEAGRHANSRSQAKVSAFVYETAEGYVYVSLSFVVSRTISSAFGQTTAEDIPVRNKKVYDKAFDKIAFAIRLKS